MKRLIDFCLLLLMVFWGSNAWADKTMTFGAGSPTNDCNLTQLNVSGGESQSFVNGGITLTITAASGAGASWNDTPGSKHEQTIGLMTNAKITISSSSAEMKITKIVFNFENNQNKGYFTKSSTTVGTLESTTATSYVSTQTWSLEEGADFVSFTNETDNKAYITSIEITYKTGGLDNHTVQNYPYTWNFTDESLWEKSKDQFVSEIWTHGTDNEDDEWRNSRHEPTVATGYDVDLLRGLRFTNHVCADKKRQCVSLPKTATITIPSLQKGQKVKIHYTGVGILPTTNLKVSQERKDNIEIYKVTQDGDAILTVDPNNTTDIWGAWISQISVIDAAPVLTMTTPANEATGVDPKLTSIKVTSEKALWAYDVNGTKTSTAKTIEATLTSDDKNNDMVVTATFTAGETGVKELNFKLPQDKQLESATTYTLNIPENVIMETSGTGNKNCSFTFSTKGLKYLGAYNGDKEIKANPYTVSTLDNNRVEFAFEEKLEKTADFKVTVYDGTTVKSYTTDSKECVISNMRLYVPVTLTAGKHYSIKITAGSLKDATAGSTLKNNQIVLNLISSVKGINLSMTTPYNQDEAPLTTRIILSAKDKDGNNKNIENNVEATLEGKSADGNQTHNIGTVTGIANGNKLVFTPKEGQQLRSNYTYTLTLKENAKLQDVKDGTLPDVTFVFTTAKVIGNAPTVESTSPAAESTIKVEDVQPAPNTSKQIEIKFNEDIQLLDGALIFCRPMGGSESYKSIDYYSVRSYSDNPIHAEGNKLSFDYSGQNLFYGMRYEVTVPTYAIVGNGGQPMKTNFKFYFETPKSAKATDSRDRKDVYTWDFTNISDSTFTKIKESVDGKKTYWGFDEKNHAYGSSNASNSRTFAQGQEIKAGASNTFILPELRGLLFNLVKNYSDRFQIVCKNKSEAKGNTYLYLNGGTHYVTIQSVPAKAMVYIEHNGSNEMFNLNTLGVDSIKTITNSNNNRVSVYRLGDMAKDLTFCVQNCKLYRIAVVKDNKTIGSAKNDYIKYATYSQSYPVDYSLNERLNGTAVTAYSVSADYQSNATFVKFTALPDNQSARGEGVILKTSGNLGENHPIFTTDVNTIPQTLTSNALVGTGDKATEFATAKKEGFQNYILTTRYFHLDKEDQVIDGNQQCFYKWVKGDAKSNFAYLQLKNPSSNATAAKTVIYLDWFGDTTGIHGMTAPSQVTSGKTYYTLDGRKVTSPTQKGIYIINGKKIIIK